MKAYFFTDDELNDDELYFIMKNFYSNRLKNKLSNLPPSPRVSPITDEEIFELAKLLNLSVGGLEDLFK